MSLVLQGGEGLRVELDGFVKIGDGVFRILVHSRQAAGHPALLVAGREPQTAVSVTAGTVQVLGPFPNGRPEEIDLSARRAQLEGFIEVRNRLGIMLESFLGLGPI